MSNFSDSALICRACLSEVNADETVSIFKRICIENEFLELSDMITKITSLIFIRDDELPKALCNKCVSDTCNAYFFREKCIISQGMLDYEPPNDFEIKEETFSDFEYEMQKPVEEHEEKFSIHHYDDDNDDKNSIDDQIVLECTNEDDNIDKSKVKCIKSKANKNILDNDIKEEFKCNYCKNSYDEIEKLLDHLEFEHADVNEIISNENEILKSEYVVGAEQLDTRCEECDQNFNNSEELADHNSLFHLEIKDIVKTLCDDEDDDYAWPMDETTTNDNSNNEIEPPVKSRINSIISNTSDSTKLRPNPYLKLKPDSIPFKCQFCPTYFTSFKTMHSHRKRFHSEQTAQFKTREQLLAESDLQEIQSLAKTVIHQNVECEFCNMKFGSYDTMRRHRKKEHPDKNIKRIPYGSGNLYKKKPNLICDFCGRGLASQNSLEIHRRQHTGDKPFVCQTCGSRYASLVLLQDHEKRHTAQKSFFCDICSKGFTRERYLVWHKKIHDPNDRPYQCELCGRKFLYKKAHEFHIRSHNGEKPYRAYEQKRPPRIRPYKPKPKKPPQPKVENE